VTHVHETEGVGRRWRGEDHAAEERECVRESVIGVRVTCSYLAFSRIDVLYYAFSLN
jgi:hypothetical protein